VQTGSGRPGLFRLAKNRSDKPALRNSDDGCLAVQLIDMFGLRVFNAAKALFQRRSTISKPAFPKPKIDQNNLRGLSKFLYLYKNPRKPHTPRLQATLEGFE
jgi:hypothetical protein